MSNTDDRVYFVHEPVGKAVKIGHSKNPPARLNDLQTSNHAELFLIGTIPGGEPMEEQLHKQFAHLRIRREWFQATEELIAAIRKLLLTIGVMRTVREELEKRKRCRVGLRGVHVCVPVAPESLYTVRSSHWNATNELVMSLDPVHKSTDPVETGPLVPGLIIRRLSDVVPRCRSAGALDGVLSSECCLASSWPVLCQCWMKEAASEC